MRARLVLCGLLAVALPATAQSRQPAGSTPWSVEAPGSLGARFGLGLDLLLDRIDDAEVVGGRQSVTTVGEDGSPRTTVVPLDVDLANRKHRQDWKELSLGLQVPVALPTLRLPGALKVEPSLVFEAAAVEGDLAFVDRVEGTPDRRLDGTAARWGVGVEALGELCRGCRWFWSAGYRYRSLDGVDLGHETPRDSGGPTLTESTEIDHDAHHLTARLGALVAGGRATAYVGVRERRSDLVVHDQATLTSPLGDRHPIEVVTRLDLDADDTATLAGADVRLGRRYVGRVEATFGGEGESVLVKVVRAHHWVAPPQERLRSIEMRRRRAAELAEAIEPALDALRQDFARSVREIEEQAGPRRPLPAASVLALLDEVEAGLRRILAAPELLPVLSWFLDFLDQARADLAGSSRGAAARRLVSGPPAPGELVFAALPVRQDPPRPEPQPPPGSAHGWLARLAEGLELLFTRADTRQLTQDLCVRSVPRSGALVTLWPKALTRPGRSPDIDLFERWTENRLSVFYRGLYAYRANLRRQTICAGAEAAPCAPIDLWKDDRPFLVCNFDLDPGLRRCALADLPLETCGR